MIKVSVIIPVYNGEKHLRQCLDSVCEQTLREIEIICVDDGSTDASLGILREYQRQDDRIQLYQQQNLYAGVARNLGKSHATGEYLAFWDCDDFFELNALELMYDRAKETEADICVCGGNQYYQELGKVIPKPDYMFQQRIPQTDVFNRKTNEDYILNFTTVPVWNKIYRRAFIEALHLDFQPIRNCNDVYFVVVAMCLAERITTIPNKLVNYRREQAQGLVNTVSQSPLAPIHAWMDVARHLQRLDAFPERSFANKALGSLIYALRHIREREAFLSAVELLKTRGLQTLHIGEQDEDYYYNKRHARILSHLIHDSSEDFLMYLMNETYLELSDQSARKNLSDQNLDKKKSEIKNLKNQQEEQSQKITTLKQENAQLTSKVKSLRKNCDTLKGKVKALREKRDALTENVEILRQKNAILKEKNKELKGAQKRLKQSWAYRIGRKIVWLPGKIKRLVQKLKRHNAT